LYIKRHLDQVNIARYGYFPEPDCNPGSPSSTLLLLRYFIRQSTRFCALFLGSLKSFVSAMRKLAPRTLSGPSIEPDCDCCIGHFPIPAGALN